MECCKEVAVTIDLARIPEESSLIDQGLKTQLSGIFGKMEGQVAIKAVVDLSREKDCEQAAFLRAVSALSDKLDLELYGPDEAGQVPELNTQWLPVTGLYRDGMAGHRFTECRAARRLIPLCWQSITLPAPDRRCPGD